MLWLGSCVKAINHFFYLLGMGIFSVSDDFILFEPLLAIAALYGVEV